MKSPNPDTQVKNQQQNKSSTTKENDILIRA